MGEIKPLGSEKLSGNEKINRILELTYYHKPINENKSINKKYELIVEGKLSTYGIEKEKDGYYVKKGINESKLDYIGGLYMKNKNRFNTYNDAFKRLDFLKGQEELNEATKYVLKQKPSLSNETPPSDDPSLPAENSEDPSPEELPIPPSETDMNQTDDLSTGVEGEDEETGDTLKDIQKLTGKLTQKLREYDDEIENDDIKYVINMVLSSVDLDKLEETDIEEIINKIEGEETEENGDLSGEEGLPMDNETEPEDDLGETYSSLEELTNTDFNFNDEVEMSEEKEFYDVVTFKELIDLANKAGEIVLDAKDDLIELGSTHNNKDGVFYKYVKEVLDNYDMTMDELLSDEDNDYTQDYTSSNDDNEEPESLDEYFFDDDDYSNANEYEISGDEEFDSFLHKKDSKIPSKKDIEGLDDDLEDDDKPEYNDDFKENDLEDDELEPEFKDDDLENDLYEDDNLTDNLVSYNVPEWALGGLINDDYTGLEDDDISKIQKFVERVRKENGNAIFLYGNDNDKEFNVSNDINDLGSDVLCKVYIRPNENHGNEDNLNSDLQINEIKEIIKKYRIN